MRKSANYGLRLPERLEKRNDPADIDDLTYDMEILDGELKARADKDKELDEMKASRTELNAHASASVLAHPDGSVTDEKIGLRSVGNVKNKLQELLTLLGEQVKAIKGTTNWNDSAAITLSQTKKTLDTHKLEMGAIQDDLNAHTANTENPHKTTKEQVGLGNVPNVPTNDQTPTYTVEKNLTALSSGEKLSAAFGKIAGAVDAFVTHLKDFANPHKVTAQQVGAYTKAETDAKDTAVKTALETALNSHKLDAGNPHKVTKVQVGLGNVTNDAQVKRSEMGKANGVATLDENGQVPAAQLPSFVDDVLEYPSKAAFPSNGESGKIYVAQDTNITWRWSGTGYVEISKSLALGETSSTAYPGDKGKAVADALAATKTIVDENTKVRHSHSNGSVLNGITATLVANWNAALQMLKIGTVNTGSTAAVTVTKDGTTAILNFTLPSGAQGLKGDKGEKGDKGDVGARGATGAQGPKGDTGARGPQGDTGATGPQGAQGKTGDTGPAGPNRLSSSTQVSGFSNGQFFCVNGSTVGAKDITPKEIGAAEKNHSHSVSEISRLLDLMYPIGCIFEWSPIVGGTVDLSSAKKVADYFGFGTWELYWPSRMTVCVDTNDPDFNAPNKIGGEKTHRLTNQELPAEYNVEYGDSGGDRQLFSGAAILVNGKRRGALGMRLNDSGGGAHNNTPLYVAVYRYRRIA